jgi:hypothetical protein
MTYHHNIELAERLKKEGKPSQQEIERIVEEFKKKWNYQGAFQNAEAYPFVESWLRTTLTSLTEAHKVEVKELQECLTEAVVLMEDVIDGKYKPHSFTTQPWRNALNEFNIEVK